MDALLDEGVWLLARNRRARDRAMILRQEARALVLTFRSHRFCPIYGASGLGGDPPTRSADEDQVRGRLRALASLGPVKTHVGLSRGAPCDACHKTISRGDIEYDVVADAVALRLDSGCYLLLVEEMPRPPGGAGLEP
jgi:hypothetical protein